MPACSRRSAFGALYVAEVSAEPRRNAATQVHKSVISGIVRPSHIPLWCRSLNEARLLLLQVRNPDDPIREHEVSCFSRALGTGNGQLQIFDLLAGAPSPAQLDAVDVVLIGGSGDYSVVRGGAWLPAALEAMVGLYESGKPTFASCWGFQALARALGGEVVTDLTEPRWGRSGWNSSRRARVIPCWDRSGQGSRSRSVTRTS